MKILDPCSATLTLSEVHTFLQTKPAPRPSPRIGAYGPTNLHGYNSVKADFELYLKQSAPHVALLPAPETFIGRLLSRLKQSKIVLTKAEVLTLIDLGIGVKRAAATMQTQTQTQANGTAATEEKIQDSVEVARKEGDGMAVDQAEAEAEPSADDDSYDYTLLTAVVEEAETRFTDAQLTEILTVLREEMPLSTKQQQQGTVADAFANGSSSAEGLDRKQISVPEEKNSSLGGSERSVTMETVLDAGGVEDEAAEDDVLLHEAGYTRKEDDGDIDGND